MFKQPSMELAIYTLHSIGWAKWQTKHIHYGLNFCVQSYRTKLDIQTHKSGALWASVLHFHENGEQWLVDVVGHKVFPRHSSRCTCLLLLYVYACICRHVLKHAVLWVPMCECETIQTRQRSRKSNAMLCLLFWHRKHSLTHKHTHTHPHTNSPILYIIKTDDVGRCIRMQLKWFNLFVEPVDGCMCVY